MRRIILDRADRVHRMPPEFVNLDRLAARLDKHLVQVIDLSKIDRRLDPEQAPPAPTVAELVSPPDQKTTQAFCEAVSGFYETRYGAKLNPQKEVLPISGSAAGLYLLGLAFVDPGEMVLVPDPGPPIYRSAAALCGSGVQKYYLHDRYNYIPDCRIVAGSLAGKTKLWILGNPQNPSTVPADRDLITEVTRLARRHNILIVYDAAFSLLADNSSGETGFLANTRARGTGVEIVSFDFNFNLGHLGLAALVGNKEALAAVEFLAGTAGLLPTQGVLEIGLWAMHNADRLIENRRRQLAQAWNELAEALEKLQWPARWNAGVPYCWVTLPRRYSSLGFARRLLRRTGVKVAPGSVFGEQGEGYARISLTTDLSQMKTAASRLVEFGRLWQKRRRTARGDD